MNDIYETERPSAAQLETTKAEVIAFRNRHQFATKIDLAIAFVLERDIATSAELHALLDLPSDQTVSSYLAPATKDLRLIKDGKHWTLGPKSTPPDPKPDALASSAELGRIGGTEWQVPKFLPPKAEEKPRPELAARPAAPRCRFAVWSDGQVEIVVDGQPPVALSFDEIDELVKFLGKIGRGA